MSLRFCSLASGSSGNCHMITDEDSYILIDAGLSGKQIQGKLQEIDIDPHRISAIIISHEHSDHIQGAGILSRRFNIPIYANEGTWRGMEAKLGKLTKDNIKTFETTKLFSIGNIQVKPYSISHDANEPVGFCLESQGFKISIATDLGCITEAITSEIKDSNLVVLESNHDVEMLKAGSYPYYLKRRILSDEGHLSNDAAGYAIVELVKNNVKNILLAHLSKENNFPELALVTVKNILEANQINIGRDLILDLAHRERVSNMYQFCK